MWKPEENHADTGGEFVFPFQQCNLSLPKAVQNTKLCNLTE